MEVTSQGLGRVPQARAKSRVPVTLPGEDVPTGRWRPWGALKPIRKRTQGLSPNKHSYPHTQRLGLRTRGLHPVPNGKEDSEGRNILTPARGAPRG